MVSTVFSRDVAAVDWCSPPLVTWDVERSVVWLEGEHDIATVAVLAEALANIAVAGDADVIVDLSGVTFMSSATIDELIRGRDLLLRQSRTLTLRSPSRRARRLLDLCGLAGLMSSIAIDDMTSVLSWNETPPGAVLAHGGLDLGHALPDGQ